MDGLCKFEAGDRKDNLETRLCCREDEKKVGSSRVRTFDLQLQQEICPLRHLRSTCLNCQAISRKSVGHHLHNHRRPAVIVDSSLGSAGEIPLSCASVSGIHSRQVCTTVSLWRGEQTIAPFAFPGLYGPFFLGLSLRPLSVAGSSRLERTHRAHLHSAIVDRRKRQTHDTLDQLLYRPHFLSTL